jgi:hypothetical protein
MKKNKKKIKKIKKEDLKNIKGGMREIVHMQSGQCGTK